MARPKRTTRFPEDFMFQLTAEEAESSRSQIATLETGRGQNIKYRPYAFTEHGAIQAASTRTNILNLLHKWSAGCPAERLLV
jgi:hypothetical protein